MYDALAQRVAGQSARLNEALAILETPCPVCRKVAYMQLGAAPGGDALWCDNECDATAIERGLNFRLEFPMFIDLEALDSDDPITASVGHRSDGLALFYTYAVNVLTGDPEQGKSLVALAVAIEVARAGGIVVWVDLDHNGVAPLHQTGCQIGAGAGLRGEGGEQTALNVASSDQRGELGVAITDIDGANDRAHINPLEG